MSFFNINIRDVPDEDANVLTSAGADVNADDLSVTTCGSSEKQGRGLVRILSINYLEEFNSF